MTTPPLPTFNPLTQPTSKVSSTPPRGFFTATGYVLAQCSDLSYQQYGQDPTPLPTAGSFVKGETYTIVGDPITTSEAIGTGTVAGQPGYYRKVPIGFVMQVSVNSTASYNVVCLRGTRTYSEWLSDATAVPAPFRVGNNGGNYSYDWVVNDAKLGSVHGGFLSLYTVGTDGQPSQKIKISCLDE